MKTFFVCGCIFLFFFIFFRSETWESYKVNETLHGVEYISVKHRLRWDRFINYLKEVPDKLKEAVSLNK